MNKKILGIISLTTLVTSCLTTNNSFANNYENKVVKINFKVQKRDVSNNHCWKVKKKDNMFYFEGLNDSKVMLKDLNNKASLSIGRNYPGNQEKFTISNSLLKYNNKEFGTIEISNSNCEKFKYSGSSPNLDFKQVRINFKVNTINVSNNDCWSSVKLYGNKASFIRSGSPKHTYLKNYNGKAAVTTRNIPGVREVFTLENNKVKFGNQEMGTWTKSDCKESNIIPPKPENDKNPSSNGGKPPAIHSDFTFSGYISHPRNRNVDVRIPRGVNYLIIAKSGGSTNHTFVNEEWFNVNGHSGKVGAKGSRDKGIAIFRVSSSDKIKINVKNTAVQTLFLSSKRKLKTKRMSDNGAYDPKLGNKDIRKDPRALFAIYAEDEGGKSDRDLRFGAIGHRFGKGDDLIYIITSNNSSKKHGNGAFEQVYEDK